MLRKLARYTREPSSCDRGMMSEKGARLFAKGSQNLDERAAVALAQQGDSDAFASLVRCYEEMAFRVAYLIVADAAEAEDVTQEAFMRAFRALGRFDTRQPFRPWLLRIVSNLARNSRRSAGRREAVRQRYEQGRLSTHTPSPEQEIVEEDEARRVWQATAALSDEDQTLLYLRYYLDLPEREAAVIIGRPVGTVKSRAHRALRRLRRIIEERYPDLAPSAPTERPSGRAT